MRVLEKAAPERGLDTTLGLMRGAGRTEDAIELVLEYLGSRWEGALIFRRDGDVLAPWLGAGVLHPRGFDDLLVPIERESALSLLAHRPALMTGPLRGGDTEKLVARLLIGNPYCEALAASVPVKREVRYVVFACRGRDAGPADKGEYQALLRELAEKLSRLESRGDERAA